MTKDEALALALNALHTKGEHHPRVYAAIAAIQTVLAQPPLPVQKPLAKKYKWVLHSGFADVASFDAEGIPSFYSRDSWTKFKYGELSVPCKGKNCGTLNGWLHSVECHAEHEAQYTAPPLPVQPEPVTWDKPSASFNEWWDSDRHDGGNPFDTDSFAYWAFEGWQAALAQRPWVGLTEEEIMVIGDKVANEELVGLMSNFRGRLARAIEQTLKEKNHG